MLQALREPQEQVQEEQGQNILNRLRQIRSLIAEENQQEQ